MTLNLVSAKPGPAQESFLTQLTEVNGKHIRKGEEISISAGTVVRLSNVLSLKFIPGIAAITASDGVTTVLQGPSCRS
jgi:hypothetical protein